MSGGWGSFDRKNGQCGGQQDRRSRSIVGPEPVSLLALTTNLPFSHRARTHADGHRVYMSGKHPPRATDRARQFEHQIADLAAKRRAAVGIIERERTCRHAGRDQFAANEIHDGRFLAAAAGNRHHLHDQRERFGVADRFIRSQFRHLGRRRSITELDLNDRRLDSHEPRQINS